jgi:negative regulator of sigma E activity
MSERQIDEAIDEAVRDLMNVDADPAFRARVAERLREPKPHAPFWRQPMVAAAAVVVVVIGVALMRKTEKPVDEERPAPVASTVAPQPAVEPRVEERTPPAVTRPPMQAAARRSAANPTQQISRGALAASVADDAPGPAPAGEVEPLGHIRPIELAPITPAPIITTEIVIAPIPRPSELVIVPLAPLTERE